MVTSVQVTFDYGDPIAWLDSGRGLSDTRMRITPPLSGNSSLLEGSQQRQRWTFSSLMSHRVGRPRGHWSVAVLHKVSEGKAAKNRVHLDLHLGSDRHDEETERLKALGARQLWFSDDRGGTVLAHGRCRR